MKRKWKAGQTSKRIKVWIQDAATGVGKTGLLFNTSGLLCTYIRDGDAAGTVVTPVTATVGTWVAGGFKEINATTFPGDYEIGIPNAAIAAGSDSVNLCIVVPGAVPCKVEIELDAVDYQSTSFGIQFPYRQNQPAMIPFPMVSSTDYKTPAPAGTVITAKRALNATPGFTVCAGIVTEIDPGSFVLSAAPADMNASAIMFQFSGPGVGTVYVPVNTVT